jgi:Tol biopolymer transport system component
MAMQPGTRLGPYEILGAIGAGGMGEVYRAKDTRLDRTVAIKVLPAHLSADPERKQRFEREARTISSLNHPNICTLHDIGHQDGIDFLVMEYLEGESLAQRLEKGPLTTELVLRYGIQIAEALDKAHRQSIIHRDLKPGNIMLTKSGAKLLDFGLAKYQEAKTTVPGQSQMETKFDPLTEEGVVLGTVQYMAPEQLEGKPADARTDIFALGEVVYEMATGQRTFKGTSKAQVMAAILSSDPPPISTVQPLAPPALDHVVKKCLAKDPDDRWQDAGDVAGELKWISEGGSQAGLTASAAPQVKTRQVFWKLSTLLAVAVAMLLATLHWRVPSSKPPLMRFTIPAPEKSSFAGPIALSPDGRKLAFVATAGGAASLWVRSLDSISPQRLVGTEDASRPFWSPDGRWIAFFAQGKLKKIEASGGSPQTLCDAFDNRGGTWNHDGVILFAPSGGEGLYRISADGGTPAPVTELDTPHGEISHRWPCFLPDGRHFLYLVWSGRPGKEGVTVGSLDSKESKRLLASMTDVSYAPPGFLIFTNEETLMGQPFDTKRLELKGQAIPLADQVWRDASIAGLAGFSISENGPLAYRNGGAQNNQFTWFDRDGNELGIVGAPAHYYEPCFSGDQKQIVFAIDTISTALDDLWIMDLASGNMSRFTFDPADDETAIWSPDGNRIVWSSYRSAAYDLFQKAANGAGKDELLLRSSTTKYATDWSTDGKFILYENQDPKTKFDLWVLPMFGDHKPMPYLRTDSNETKARFSPDGRWVAYVSDESGRAEVYVQSFPTTGGKRQISTGGGGQIQWRRDGKELFYLTSGGKLMAVEINASASTLQVGVAKSLLGVHVLQNNFPGIRNSYLATSDGQRFLVSNPTEDTSSAPITVVLNWTSLLKR